MVRLHPSGVNHLALAYARVAALSDEFVWEKLGETEPPVNLD